MKPSALFNEEEERGIIDAIRRVEQECSVEIRVHVENHCPGRVLDRAAGIFDKLGMSQTEARNGILIYVALADRVSALIGDINVDKHTGADFWQETDHKMNGYFSRRRFAEGIAWAIARIGEELKSHFPTTWKNKNELPDDISFGD